MTSVNVRIEGLDKLARKANRNHLLGGPLKRFFTSSAIAVQRNAKKRVPVDTGRLRRSITYEVDAAGIPLWAKVGSNVEYAPYQEFGTSAHFPPPAAMETWARRHGLPNGFVAARAIAAHGVPEKRYMRGGLEDSVPEIRRHLVTAAGAIEEKWGG